jgi:hypothetical protein
MKAIHDLVSYFKEKKKLSARQIDELVAKGYWKLYTPAELRGLEGQLGQSFSFEVTGNADGPLWGTDIYTSDSNLGTACVHSGILKVGQHGIVKVRIVKTPNNFQGTTRHGVTSSSYGAWKGAYQVEAFKQ